MRKSFAKRKREKQKTPFSKKFEVRAQAREKQMVK